MSPPRVVIGATDHYARAELVTLAERDGAPVLLDRRRVELLEDGLPVAPYHHEALAMELEAATELVARVRSSAEACARAGLAALLERHPAEALILPASPFERLPDSLREVLDDARLTNAADGMLYREVLAHAAARAGLEVHRYSRKAEPAQLAAEALRTDVPAVLALVKELGRAAGTPWRDDHKRAAAVALSLLGPRLRS